MSYELLVISSAFTLGLIAFWPFGSYYTHIDKMPPAPSHGSSSPEEGGDEVEPLDGELVNRKVNFHIYIFSISSASQVLNFTLTC